MPALTIKGMSPELLDRLRRQAAAHRRSVNQEVLACLEAQTRGEPFVLAEFLERVRARRTAMAAAPLSAAEIDAAKRMGRP